MCHIYSTCVGCQTSTIISYKAVIWGTSRSSTRACRSKDQGIFNLSLHPEEPADLNFGAFLVEIYWSLTWCFSWIDQEANLSLSLEESFSLQLEYAISIGESTWFLISWGEEWLGLRSDAIWEEIDSSSTRIKLEPVSLCSFNYELMTEFFLIPLYKN